LGGPYFDLVRDTAPVVVLPLLSLPPRAEVDVIHSEAFGLHMIIVDDSIIFPTDLQKAIGMTLVKAL